jgi:hypothetical protein
MKNKYPNSWGNIDSSKLFLPLISLLLALQQHLAATYNGNSKNSFIQDTAAENYNTKQALQQTEDVNTSK